MKIIKSTKSLFVCFLVIIIAKFLFWVRSEFFPEEVTCWKFGPVWRYGKR